MAHDPTFDTALEAVFEEHAPRFSGDLRNLLHQFFLEGIKEGRARTLQETAKLEQRLDELKAAADPYILMSAAADNSFETSEMTLDSIKAAVEKLDSIAPTRKSRPDPFKLVIESPLPEPPRREIMGRWFDEVTGWNSRKKTS